VVGQLAAHIARNHPDLRGFTRPNLFRMRQFYETYRDDSKVAPLVRQLPWTHNLLFTFVGERYRLQVGTRDFFADLLFFHRGPTCLVAFELKVEQFEPSDLGQQPTQ